jgi:cytoskeletal protein RodZ
MFKLFSLRMFLAAMLLGGTLFAQHYQGRDHTVFHPAAPPPAKHPTAAPAATPSGTRASDTSRRHEATYSSSTATHTAQPPQTYPRPK